MKEKIKNIPKIINMIKIQLDNCEDDEEYDRLLGELDYYQDLEARFKLAEITKEWKY